MDAIRNRTRWPRIAVATAAASLLLACSDALGPFQPQITNAPDNFQLQATGLNNVTTTVQYTWQNSGTTANVNQATVTTAGTATLVIKDAASTQVYTKDLNANGTFVTTAGTSGAWTIRVELVNVSGTLNFRVQKP